jgi:hypothetical protein
MDWYRPMFLGHLEVVDACMQSTVTMVPYLHEYSDETIQATARMTTLHKPILMLKSLGPMKSVVRSTVNSQLALWSFHFFLFCEGSLLILERRIPRQPISHSILYKSIILHITLSRLQELWKKVKKNSRSSLILTKFIALVNKRNDLLRNW